MMRKVPYRQLDRDRVDAYVSRHPNATAYHFSAWMGAVEKAYQHDGWYIVSENDAGTIDGLLPLCRLKLPFGRSSLVSLPFCDLSGPLSDSITIEKQMIEEAIGLLPELGARKLELRRAGESMVDSVTHESGGAVKVSMLAGLPDSAEALFEGFKAKLRSQIRKAEKNGLSFELGEGAVGVEHFYKVFARNMKRLGSPVHDRRWFEAIQALYGKQAVIGLVRYDERIVGAGLILIHPHRVSIPWASTLAEYNHLAPNMLLYWELMKVACTHNAKLFDFGRSTMGEGTFRFKKQWGAEPRRLSWDEYNRTGLVNPVTPAKPSLMSRLRPWVESGWQALPDPIANRVGPKLRRYISL
ncbi:FemAB family XrtA/PEP-CTERM system-associated protein [Saccharospirillum salsuginis]|uniref:BioF2-like acetyltransferase domain-containing protein n=1 Tax=Saccharospirillum salsuginis TaxID=418750 RepID=A0A918K516_9GAMM|nr:FemAB family XrtA/PEP-CTERM system-associated protein [Saccharospirillum salsuginis]GGX49558.1 hypothetical protein GCM10007392_16110 [Saccharospirillum salsuginis]